jgi:hypothetical protein
MFENETDVKNFYKNSFKKEMAFFGLDFWNVEHGHGGSVGLPDLVHPSKLKGNVYFGLEFKFLEGDNIKLKFRPQQVRFHHMENLAGNKTFLIVGTPFFIFVLGGDRIRDINGQTLEECFYHAELCTCNTSKPTFKEKMSEILYKGVDNESES